MQKYYQDGGCQWRQHGELFAATPHAKFHWTKCAFGKGANKKRKKTGKRWTSKNKCSHKVVKGKRNKKKSTDADKNPTTWAKWVAAPQQHFQKAEKGTEETKKKKERNRRCSGPR